MTEVWIKKYLMFIILITIIKITQRTQKIYKIAIEVTLLILMKINKMIKEYNFFN